MKSPLSQVLKFHILPVSLCLTICVSWPNIQFCSILLLHKLSAELRKPPHSNFLPTSEKELCKFTPVAYPTSSLHGLQSPAVEHDCMDCDQHICNTQSSFYSAPCQPKNTASAPSPLLRSSFILSPSTAVGQEFRQRDREKACRQ